MNVQDFFEYLEEQNLLGVKLSTIFWITITAIIALVLERAITRYLRRFAKRAGFAPNVTNGFVLTFRLLILVGATAALIRVGGLPAECFVAFSALGGAAVGLASTRTIGNFIAGIYLLMSRPFKVGDYVRVGTVEGVVQEITINYTKILTMGNNVVSISNLQIMDRDITNYLYEAQKDKLLYCYTFEIGFDHSVSATRIREIFNEVFEQYNPKLPRNLSYTLARSGAFERVYLVYLYVVRPEDVFVYRPQVAEEAFKRWDMAREKVG